MHKVLSVCFITVCMAALFVPSASANSGPPYEDVGSFQLAIAYPVGANPFGVVLADFNSDGHIDLASSNEGDNSITVRLGTGTGTFGSSATFAAGTAPHGLAAADFNADGTPDIAVANLFSNDISVLLGTGTGAFGSQVRYTVGVNPRSVSIGDFNQDGKPDLAVPNGSNGQISVLIGAGNGGFAAAVGVSVGGGAISAVVADFNKDSHQDLAVANEQSNTVSILLGTGVGTFVAGTSVPTPQGPRYVAAADFNADGFLDLAVACVDGGVVAVFGGATQAQFGAANPLQAGVGPTAVVARDLNGDGKPELVVGNQASHNISILLGTGTLDFGPPSNFTTGNVSNGIAVGNLNGDAGPDLVVANRQDNNVTVLLADVLPVLTVPPVAAVNATTSYTLRKSTLWINRQVPGSGLFSHAMYADFNRDGYVDFVRTFGDNADLRRPLQVMANDGTGGFVDVTATAISNTQPGIVLARKLITGDYNSDGWPDVFVLPHGYDVFPAPGEYPQLFLSNGDGSLRYVPELEGDVFFNHGGASADIDGNGTIDILVINPNTPFFLLNDGQGHLTHNYNRLPSEVFGSHPQYTGELIDVDGDGFIDILLGGDDTEPSTLGTVIYWGGSSGYYRASSKTVLPTVVGWNNILDYASEDIDNDGDRDLILDRGRNDPPIGRYIQVLRQVSPRVFVDETQARMTMDTSLHAFDYFRVQDINGDGSPDIFIDDMDFVSEGEYAWANNGQGYFTPYTGPVNPRSETTSMAMSDVRVVEGNSGSHLATFTVRLNQPAATPVTFNIATIAGTATAGSDFQATSNLGRTIAAGQASAIFTVSINGDTEVETNEAFTVAITNVSGASVVRGTATGVIADDDLPSLSIADASVSEGDLGQKLLNFQLSLSIPAPNQFSFDVFTDPGTAIPGVDYQSMSQMGATIPAGQSTASVSVPVNGDTAVEGNETFTVNLANVVNALVVDGQAQGRINNDDPGFLSIADVSVMEGGAGQHTATFVVRLSAPLPNPVTFDIATSNGTATAGSDYVARAQTGRYLDAGRTNLRFEVLINGDGTPEANESFTATISNASGALVSRAAAIGTIVNDDGSALAVGAEGQRLILAQKRPVLRAAVIPWCIGKDSRHADHAAKALGERASGRARRAPTCIDRHTGRERTGEAAPEPR